MLNLFKFAQQVQHFAFTKTEETVCSLLYIHQSFVCFEKLIHIQGRTLNNQKNIIKSKLPNGSQLPVLSPELIALIHICVSFESNCMQL
jgi:hypothetical protein